LGLGYSKFINLLKAKNIIIDRKILAQLAHRYPQVFTATVEQIKG